MTQVFCIDSYRALLDGFAGRGYTARPFAEAEPGRRDLILRHDLDVSLEAALPVAEAERQAGVSATYFVLTRSEFYNPYSEAGSRALARLLSLGHEIGLHLDASLYGDEAALEEGAEREVSVLEMIAGREVSMISFHRPGEQLLGLDRRLAGRAHAYEPRFFTDMGYCSDSRGGWRHGAPLEHAAVAEDRALQLLTHPIWWRDPPAEPAARLTRFLNERMRVLDEELAVQSDVHTPERPARARGSARR